MYDFDIQEETKKRLREIMKERFDIDEKDIEFVPPSPPLEHKCTDYCDYCKKGPLEHGYTMRFCERFNQIAPLGMECIEVYRKKKRNGVFNGN